MWNQVFHCWNQHNMTHNGSQSHGNNWRSIGSRRAAFGFNCPSISGIVSCSFGLCFSSFILFYFMIITSVKHVHMFSRRTSLQ